MDETTARRANSLGVQREGQVFVINPKTWTVAYRGPGWIGHVGCAAVDALLAGQALQVTRVSSPPAKPDRLPGAEAHAADFANIFHSREVAPIPAGEVRLLPP